MRWWSTLSGVIAFTSGAGASSDEGVDQPVPTGPPSEAETPAPSGWRLPLRLASRAAAALGGVVRDPRTIGVVSAPPRVARFLAQARQVGADDDAPALRTTPGLAIQALVDEVLIAAFHHPDLVPGADDYGPAAHDLSRTRELFAARGWLAHPAGYHRDPGPPEDLRSWPERALGLRYDHVTFSSGWEPDAQEPGRDRWLGHEANTTVHAWVARARQDRGAWLVCAHGFGMGANPFTDLRAFRAPQLLGRQINVVVPVMPLHGPRASGRVRGEDLMTIDLVDSMHGIAQATWDLRRTVRWLRASEGAERVGVIGYSLGGLVAALTACLEEDLACVIAGIPVVDLPALFRRHGGSNVGRLAEEHGVLGPAADDVHRVVSPLAMACKVPVGRRYVFAGLADRMSTFEQARRLWVHWDRPQLASYPGGHVGFFWSPMVKRFVDEAVAGSLAA